MTLLRQLIFVIVTLFILLFAGTFSISVHNTRAYLAEQLKTISQDTATSLGVTLSPHFAEGGDMVVIERLIDAVFDSGYYREVILRGVDDNILVERRASTSLEAVPAWFVTRYPLETPRGEALVMDGWQQAGTILVSPSAGHAYMTLWRNTEQSFWWFLGASIVTFLIGVLLLHYVLRPLRAVEVQAKAICDRQYPVQDKIPWTLELRSVVEAMNRMTTKVKEMFDEQADTMERIRTENYRDPVTGLANRRYFDMQLRFLLAAEDRFLSGALILLEVKGLKGLNERSGFSRVDALLEGVAHLIESHCSKLDGVDHFAAHIAGADFAIVLADVPEKECEEFVAQFMQSLPQLHDKGLIDTLDIAHAGLVCYHGQAHGDFLSEADSALRAAQAKGSNAWQVQRASARAVATRSASEWTASLRRILDEGRMMLFRQDVRMSGQPQSLMQHEVLLRVIEDSGELVSAGVFVPMAKRLGLIHEFDRFVVREVMARLRQGHELAVPVAINLFPASIRDQGFLAWLYDELAAAPAIAQNMIFEISEYGAMEDLGALRDWVNRLRKLGARTTIDHFGKGFTSFGYLCDTRIDFLKVDGSFIAEIERSKDHRFFVESLVRIAHGLDMTVIAESVEDERVAQILVTLGVDGLQGYGVSAPMPWVSRDQV